MRGARRAAAAACGERRRDADTLRRAELASRVTQPRALGSHSERAWKRRTAVAVGGGVAGDVLLPTLFSRSSTVNMHHLYKLNPILFLGVFKKRFNVSVCGRPLRQRDFAVTARLFCLD